MSHTCVHTGTHANHTDTHTHEHPLSLVGPLLTHLQANSTSAPQVHLIWGVQPPAHHPAPTCCRQMRVCELILGWKLQFGTTSVQNFLRFALLCFHLRFLSSPIRGFLLPGNFSSFRTPSSGWILKILCLPFCLYLLPYLIPSRLACLLDSWGPQPGFRRCALGIVPHTGYLLIYL